MYVCYDIKGIQRFIFSIPKLKCVIGGSCLIDEFDRQADALERDGDVDLIFSGGGRGAFRCADDAAAHRLASRLKVAAHESGLDIRLGIDPDLAEASKHADQLYPCWPETADGEDFLAGEPCALSGQWPVPAQTPPGCPRGVHPLAWLRVQKAREDTLGTRVLEQLKSSDLLPDSLGDYELSFFSNVAADAEDGPEGVAEAEAGRVALGRTNRWAVVAMDGNDMGRQFRALDALDLPEQEKRSRLGQMSAALGACTSQAFYAGLAKTIEEWLDDLQKSDDTDVEDCLVETPGAPPAARLVLPFRPLILGGDDVLMLCHSAYAMSFVKHMSRAFQEYSAEAGGDSNWIATGGELTMSAGILYCKATFPLHLAIPYAESLLGSAKGRYRMAGDSGKPTPAAVDWDAVTDTLLDTPADRRNRELRFRDPDLDAEICLTRRPYLLESDGQHPDLLGLEATARELAGLPTSMLARIFPSLRRPWSERVEFVASVAKRHKVVKDLLWENGSALGKGWSPATDEQPRSTGVPDALLLLEEERRVWGRKDNPQQD